MSMDMGTSSLISYFVNATLSRITCDCLAASSNLYPFPTMRIMSRCSLLTLLSKMKRHCSGSVTIFSPSGWPSAFSHIFPLSERKYFCVVADFQIGVASICNPSIPPTVTGVDVTALKSGSDCIQDRKSSGKGIRCPSIGSTSFASVTM